MKILNLYAGIGGNRKLWGDKHEVTAVEINSLIAEVYKDFFPKDKVVVGDAHEYLLEHFKEFDFIWSSPPCQSHSKMYYTFGVCGHGYKSIYPDMRLYEEIILLKHHFKGTWVVENVSPYYKPLIKPTALGRHLFWFNFRISPKKFDNNSGIAGHTKRTGEHDYFNLDKYKIKKLEKTKMNKNCVNPEMGLHVFRSAFKDKQILLNLH